MRSLGWLLLLVAPLACSGSSFDVGSSSADSSLADSASGDSSSSDSEGSDSTSLDSTSDDTALVDSPGDTSSDAPPLKCGDATTYPTFVKGCTSDANCSFGLHQTSCCGSLVAIGFNHAEKTSFDATESAWRATCPACGCPAAPTVDEFGKTGSTFEAKCESGMCVARVKG